MRPVVLAAPLCPCAALGQRILSADGKTGAYELVESVFGARPETPGCGHRASGPHITQEFDRTLGRPVFVFRIRVEPDNDRCMNLDRQPLEVKSDGLDLWRPETTVCRPKWGIYRCLASKGDLRDEDIRFDRFCIAKENSGSGCGNSPDEPQ
jgi:hypothetical protein